MSKSVMAPPSRWDNIKRGVRELATDAIGSATPLDLLRLPLALATYSPEAQGAILPAAKSVRGLRRIFQSDAERISEWEKAVAGGMPMHEQLTTYGYGQLADGKVVRKVSDEGAKFEFPKAVGEARDVKMLSAQRGYGEESILGHEYPLADVLRHPNIPPKMLRGLSAINSTKGYGLDEYGMYLPNTPWNKPAAVVNTAADYSDAAGRSTATTGMHETTHAILDKYRFPRGSSPDTEGVYINRDGFVPGKNGVRYTNSDQAYRMDVGEQLANRSALQYAQQVEGKSFNGTTALSKMDYHPNSDYWTNGRTRR